jgi:hypothetical protein
MKNAYKIVVGITEGKKPLARPRSTWGIILKWSLKKQNESGDWIHLAH